MTQSSRKFVGTMLVLLSIVAYCVVAGAIYANFLGNAPWWALIVFFAVIGSTWFFPAAWLIRWMAKPDKA